MFDFDGFCSRFLTQGNKACLGANHEADKTCCDDLHESMEKSSISFHQTNIRGMYILKSKLDI